MSLVTDFLNSLNSEIKIKPFKKNLKKLFNLFKINSNKLKGKKSYHYFFLNTPDFYQKNFILVRNNKTNQSIIKLYPLDQLEKNKYVLSLKKFTKILNYEIVHIPLKKFNMLDDIFTRLSNKETLYLNIFSFQKILLTDKYNSSTYIKYVINAEPKQDFLANGYNTPEFNKNTLKEKKTLNVNNLLFKTRRIKFKRYFYYYQDKFIFTNKLVYVPNEIQLDYELGYLLGIISLQYIWIIYKNHVDNTFIYTDNLFSKNLKFKKHKFRIIFKFENDEIFLLNKIIDAINKVNSKYNDNIVFYSISYNYEKDCFYLEISSLIILLLAYSMFFILSKYDEYIKISDRDIIKYIFNKDTIEGFITGFSDANLTKQHLKNITNKKKNIARIYCYNNIVPATFIFLSSFFNIPFVYNRVPMWDYSNISKETVTEIKSKKRVYYKFLINMNKKYNAYRKLKNKMTKYNNFYMLIYYNKKIKEYIKNGFNIIHIETFEPNIILSDGTTIYGISSKNMQNILKWLKI